jgi:hypothetical protein
MALKCCFVHGPWRNCATDCLYTETAFPQQLIKLIFRSSRGCHYNYVRVETTGC